jgi:hypothetical protein
MEGKLLISILTLLTNQVDRFHLSRPLLADSDLGDRLRNPSVGLRLLDGSESRFPELM